MSMDIKSIAGISYTPKNIQKKEVSFGGSFVSNSVKSGVMENFLSALGSSFKAGSEVSSQGLNKLFLKNGFQMNEKGQVYKKLSLAQQENIYRRFGDKAEMVKDFFKPSSKQTQEQFKEFLSIGDNFKAAQTNFDEMFILFSTMNERMRDYDQIVDYLKMNPKYSSLLQNIAKNPVKNRATYDSIQRYKGCSFEKINSALRNVNSPAGEISNDIKNISSFLDTQIIKNPIRLYRGEGLDVLNNVKLKNGKTINLAKAMREANGNQEKINKIREFVLDNEITAHQNGFLSTTIDKKIAKDFSEPKLNKEAGMLWVLDTKPNTKGAYIDPVNLRGSLSQEVEVLMQKNSDIVIKDINYKDGMWYLKGEVSN